jgi:hypothetical protein
MAILLFIKDLLIATLGQILSLFGGIFIIGLLIHFFSQLTFKSLGRAFGSSGTYFVAWLGTPIHELGHALFCLIFMHRIEKVEFFNPDPVSGTLGYVAHRWNRRNPWAVLGNFFIGVGPVILGCFALFVTFYFLIPNSSGVWSSVMVRVSEIEKGYSVGSYLTILGNSAFAMVRLIFTVDNLTGWRFWVFCYLSICVASNIRLSLSDIKGAISGSGLIILFFLVINLVGLLTGYGNEKIFPFTASSLGLIYSLLILALVMVLLGFVLTYIVSAAWVRLRHRYVLNPF